MRSFGITPWFAGKRIGFSDQWGDVTPPVLMGAISCDQPYVICMASRAGMRAHAELHVGYIIWRNRVVEAAVEAAVEEEAKAPAEAVAQAPEKKGMSTGKKVGIGVTILTAVAGLVWGLTKIFGGGDDTDVIDTTGSVE